MSALKTENENPWYLLMTLFGESGDPSFGKGTAALNRKAWGLRGSGNSLSGPELEAVAAMLGVPEGEIDRQIRWAEVCERLFEKKANALGIDVTIPRSNSAPDFSQTSFQKPLDFRGYNLNSANFDGSVFSHDVDFTDVQFEGITAFKSASFTNRARFNSATFEGQASFAGTHFASAIFEDVAFNGNANFDDAVVERSLICLNAKFNTDVSFRNAQLGTRTVFSKVKFTGFADFYCTTFGTNTATALTFANAVFESPVSFEKAKFPNRYPIFSGTTLHKTTTFTAADDHWPRKHPHLLRRLDERLGLVAKSKPAQNQSAEEAKSSASKLRYVMASQALPEEEHFFFRREMHNAGRTGAIYNRLPIRFYEAVSDFGYSIGTPALLIVALWFFGTLIYVRWTAMGLWTAAGYSFSAMFKFFGFQRTYMLEETIALSARPWMEVVSAGQTVLAFMILFFLGLGLRTRFRLR